ncbi:MAG TPA: hypothetical protein PKZ29_02015 [Candidatus Woesebacteria bacterium]|jgi:hypothetical protein|nr:hypothetical protein [Candidatus Woesebacteria bacterium]HOG37675.1 hypothetical protein [Candidatus Woesebacteria bacterium]
MTKINKKDEYSLELEIVTKTEYDRPKKVDRMVQRNLKKVIMNRLDGKMGEC